jgi:arylformamidase
MDDYRVEFDFEIDFSNGGGLQGQGFRLDIDADDIDDAELADYIVRDLRLLMVGEVRILHKRILRERHKRSGGAEPGRAAVEGRAVIDLSNVVEDGIGTYLDATDVAELPLERLADLDAVVVNVAGSAGRAVDRAHLLPYDVAGRAVLVHTGRDPAAGQPYLAAAAVDHLIDQGALLLGIDSSTVDDADDAARRAHTALLAAGVPICRQLTNVTALPTDGFRFSAVPAKIKNTGTVPVRAYAILDPEPAV